jgi:hypothetical protein
VYTVKLTIEDDLWQTNTDAISVYVESTDPIPQFTITPSNTRKYPSEFIKNPYNKILNFFGQKSIKSQKMQSFKFFPFINFLIGKNHTSTLMM